MVLLFAVVKYPAKVNITVPSTDMEEPDACGIFAEISIAA